jgi:ABC-2 type transport system permease protein
MWLFAVPVRGSLVVVAVASVLYLMTTTLGVGLLISTLSQTQQQAFLGGFLFTLPAMLLSGVMTPIGSMPGWLQTFTHVNQSAAVLRRGDARQPAHRGRLRRPLAEPGDAGALRRGLAGRGDDAVSETGGVGGRGRRLTI